MAEKNVLHNANTRSEVRYIELLGVLKWEGYGLFWALKEQLTLEPTHILPKNYNFLGGMFGVDSGTIKRLVCDFGLFSFTEDGSGFYSEDIMQHFKSAEARSKILSEAGKKGMRNRWKRKAEDNEVITGVIENDNLPYNGVITRVISEDINNQERVINSNNSNSSINNSNKINLNNNSLSSCTEQTLQGDKDLFGGDIQHAEKQQEELSEFKIILNDGSLYWITKKDLEIFKECYQGFDVEQELLRLYSWTYSNPTKRKTRKGAKRFINSWLSRRQDSGGGRGYTQQPSQTRFAPIPTSERPIGEPSSDNCPF